EYGAKQVDQGAGPGLRLRVENIDTNVTIGLQSPGCSQHEQPGMGVKHRLLQLDRAQAERIAHHDGDKFRDHNVEATPRRNAADHRDAAIDAAGDRPGVVFNAAVHNWAELRHFGVCDRSLRRSIMANIGRREPAGRRPATGREIWEMPGPVPSLTTITTTTMI